MRQQLKVAHFPIQQQAVASRSVPATAARAAARAATKGAALANATLEAEFAARGAKLQPVKQLFTARVNSRK